MESIYSQSSFYKFNIHFIKIQMIVADHSAQFHDNETVMAYCI